MFKRKGIALCDVIVRDGSRSFVILIKVSFTPDDGMAGPELHCVTIRYKMIKETHGNYAATCLQTGPNGQPLRNTKSYFAHHRRVYVCCELGKTLLYEMMEADRQQKETRIKFKSNKKSNIIE